MKFTATIKCAVCLLTLTLAESFAPLKAAATKPLNPAIPRGGATSLSAIPLEVLGETVSTISTALSSGPCGVLALSAATWSVVLPLTLYKKIYGIGVAYGFSVFAAGLALLKTFSLDPTSAASLLAKACMFYGFRLGSYLLLRNAIRNNEYKLDNGPIFGRLTFSMSLALFYAFLTTPALYACRNVSTSPIALAGASLAWFGAVLEAVADVHKLIVKQSNKDSKDFVGPTFLSYRICRHPNYLGEILFWIGLFVGGAPSFGKSIPAWACSSLGVFGIVSIMQKAASGLEKKQTENYGGQKKYETWKKEVRSSLIPFL